MQLLAGGMEPSVQAQGGIASNTIAQIKLVQQVMGSSG